MTNQPEKAPTVTRERLSPSERARRTPRSLRLAINGHCYQCQGENADPSFQWRIGNCEIPDCSLWSVRPYQDMKDEPDPMGLREK